MSQSSLSLFAITPDSAPDHPVVQAFKVEVQQLEGQFEFLTFHYSENSLFNFLHRLPVQKPETGQSHRIVMAFGLEQLRPDLLRQEMEQLNLGRERIFEQRLILVFWLNRESFLEEFRRQAADFWDWRGKVAKFTTIPQLDPLLYPYLEWLISENSRLRISGVMQVNRQVDISLDQIYVSLKGAWAEQRSQSFRERTVKEQTVTVGESSHLEAMSAGVDLGERGPETDGGPRQRVAQTRLVEVSKLETVTEPTIESDVRSQRVTKVVDLAEAVQKHAYCVILGDPGAGKTTLLRYLARHFALSKRERSVVAILFLI